MTTFAVENPSTGESEDSFTRIDDADRDAILDRATAAQREWRTTTLEERAQILRRTAEIYREREDELAALIGREMGKLRRQAVGELGTVAKIYEWYADHAHDVMADRELPAEGSLRTFVRKDPLGVVVGIMPWNYPYYQVARWAAPNLLVGNALVLKHASICPLSSQACEDILVEAGLPEGVFQNIYAAGSQMDAFIADKRVAAVSLTGSEDAGAAVAKTAGEHYKKSLLELGGNDPFVVLDDHNLDQVLRRYVGARMSNAGQSCTAPKRLIVLDEFYDRALEYLTDKIGGLTVGPWDDESAKVGPLSSISARDEIVERIEDAAQNGDATVVVGGRALDRDGAYMEPALLTDVDPRADIGRNEIFGPVALLYRAADVEEAVAIANDTDYGLGSYVYSADLDLARDVASRMEAGMTWINEAGGGAPGQPFGGIGRSGYGRELGQWGVDEFANEHLFRVNEAP
ncbi:succinate-semialdehyde dehydrogenase / glutarate-semialdehyde dehydrogenase [Corynebacterium pollutisoli]|uniref:Succinate-semialdehyde dehydrogenase / glutarate-semialdehyde dehydrogenase n=1 Tax=Corynebacterium pollutisoli TaxID=1610489 RepID=A0A1X7JCB7_9CORY|nr:NAD-dependent succinate-semialdehyde dehydrogenase [Corynebacterium pollutisoli]SMG25198.1 succinate-semialdehyde dehydrogenase / glutarate-semialdehyde dehydrogenase [Corynebacterium pollutisoli]